MSGGTTGMVRKLAVAAAFLVLATVPARAAGPAPVPLPISTGGVTGIYYQIGAAICRLLRDHPADIAIDCQTEGSAGSTANVQLIAGGRSSIGLAQSDTIYYAVTGTGVFAEAGPDTGIRALCTRHVKSRFFSLYSIESKTSADTSRFLAKVERAFEGF